MKINWRKFKNYTGVLIVFMLCALVAIFSVLIHSPRTNLGKIPVLSLTEIALYDSNFDKTHLLLLMPDKFALPSDIGFFPSEPLLVVEKKDRERSMKSMAMLSTPRNVISNNISIIWPRTKISYTTKDVSFSENIFERDKTGFCSFRGLSVLADTLLAENDFQVPNIPFELFPTNLMSCSIKTFVRVKNGCVSDVFIEESDAPYEVNNHVLQKIYRATVRKETNEIYGNVFVAWKR